MYYWRNPRSKLIHIVGENDDGDVSLICTSTYTVDPDAVDEWIRGKVIDLCIHCRVIGRTYL